MPELTALRAQNFRCFTVLECALGAGATVFVGDNAQGKTSVLEAVCVLLRLQSPRASQLGEMARFGQAGFGLSGDLKLTNGTQHQLTFQWEAGQRRLAVKREPVARPAAYLEQSAVLVWMGHDDLALVRGPGETRRRYLDFLGTQLFPGYRTALLAYEKALRSRNRLLKEGGARPAELAAYTAPLLEHGMALTQWRRDIVTALQPHAMAAHAAISEVAGEDLTLIYQPSAGEDFAAALAARAEEEARRGLTLVGPHRDELTLLLYDRPAAAYASEGQVRTLALALKLAQSKLLEERWGEPPLFLIDDIFGELDPRRRNALLRALPLAAQSLITTTRVDWLTPDFPLRQLYHVQRGTLTAPV